MIKNGRQNGFTLVELIVATTLTVLVAGSTTGILRSITGTRSRVENQATVQRQLRVSLGVMATAIKNSHRVGGKVGIKGIDDWRDDMPADRIRMFTVSHNTIRPGQPESDVMEVEFGLVKQSEQPDSSAMLVRRIDHTKPRT